MWQQQLSCCFLAVLYLVRAVNFADFGAVADEDTWPAAQHNTRALLTAVEKVNKTDNSDRTISFSEGSTYYFTNVTIDGAANLTFDIAATLRFSNKVERYNFTESGGNTSFLLFTNSKYISVGGPGTIDGQGMEWWRLCYLGK